MQNKLEIRLAALEDVELVYNWSNDSVTRQSSFNSEAIKWTDHKKWFAAKLASKNSTIYIIEQPQAPIALVRFKRGDETVIGITVAPESRGKGWAAPSLVMACNLFKQSYNETIFAYIKKTNRASVRAFEKAGFVHKKETVINNRPCYLLKK